MPRNGSTHRTYSYLSGNCTILTTRVQKSVFTMLTSVGQNILHSLPYIFTLFYEIIIFENYYSIKTNQKSNTSNFDVILKIKNEKMCVFWTFRCYIIPKFVSGLFIHIFSLTAVWEQPICLCQQFIIYVICSAKQTNLNLSCSLRLWKVDDKL